MEIFENCSKRLHLKNYFTFFVKFIIFYLYFFERLDFSENIFNFPKDL